MRYFTLYQDQEVFFPDKSTAIRACDELGLRFFFPAPEPILLCYWKEDDGSWVPKTEAQMHRDKNYV